MTTIYKKKPLYKQTKSGKMQFHQIVAYLTPTSNEGTYKVSSYYGQVEGTVQIAEELVVRDSLHKLKAYVDSKYNRKLNREGYYESEQAARVDLNRYIRPMLAKDYTKDGHKIKFPCMVQPKLDGHRCVAVVLDGKCTLYSRKGERITSMNHIRDEVQQIAAARNYRDITLDGELMHQDSSVSFENTSSLVRLKTAKPECRNIKLNVFDTMDKSPFWERALEYTDFCTGAKYLKAVPTTELTNADQVDDLLDTMIADGHEGVMLRNRDSRYKHSRSPDLQKLKRFMDSEFEIVDVVPGKGKMSACGVFVCKLPKPSTETFNVKCEGSLESLEEYLTNKEQYIGKQLTVKYQELTKYGKPRFPVGKAVRV